MPPRRSNNIQLQRLRLIRPPTQMQTRNIGLPNSRSFTLIDTNISLMLQSSSRILFPSDFFLYHILHMDLPWPKGVWRTLGEDMVPIGETFIDLWRGPKLPGIGDWAL